MQNPLRYLYSRKVVPSEKNGEIVVQNILGLNMVLVDGFVQSGAYINWMLATMLAKIPRGTMVDRILLIGLGGGDGLRTLRKRYPGADIYVIEHDPVMVELSKKRVLDKLNFLPQIYLGDALTITNRLAGERASFDLVVVDLFTGGQTSPHLASEDFVQILSSLVSPEGYLMVNFFRDYKSLSQIFERRLQLKETLTYRYNEMAIYAPRLAGTPPIYTPYQQSEIWLQSAIHKGHPQVVGGEGSRGLRSRFGPLVIEWYTTDVEPRLLPTPGIRLVIWSPLTNRDRVTGWHQSGLRPPGSQIGIASDISMDYWRAWSLHAQRHRQKWRQQSVAHIETVTLPEFITHYMANSILSPDLKRAFIHELSGFQESYPDRLHLRLVVAQDGQKALAGLATVGLTDISQTLHLSSFVNSEGKKVSAGYGLIDDWYQRSQQESLEGINFGFVYRTGDPKSWQGYSKFKRQFGLKLFKLPLSFFRITVGSRSRQDG